MSRPRPGQPSPGIDWTAAAAGIEQLREFVSAAVAALVAEGFTPEQARELVVATFRSGGRS